jgi:anti-sigma B factor antagonist
VPDRDRVLVRPVGEVDIATAAELEEPIVELLERGFERVVVDLRAVTFFDSTAVHVLIRCNQRAGELRARMSVILGGSASRRALETTGMIDRLEIEHGWESGRTVPDR